MDQNQIYDLFKKIDSKVDSISVALARAEVEASHVKEDMRHIRSDINYHIKRTDLLETEVTKIRGFFFYFSVIIGFIGAATTIVTGLWSILH